MQLETLDLWVIFAYFVGVVGLGCYFVKTSRTSSAYMTAGGTLPAWAIGLSMLGTYLSSNTFILVPARAYATNWDYIWFSLSLLVAGTLAARWFIPMYRQRLDQSAYARLEDRFGPWARLYGALCFLLTQLARSGAIYLAISLVLVTLTGWSQWQIIVVSGIAVTLYTAMGGIEAVIWTDVVQSLVLIAGAVTLLVVLLLGMPEGPLQAIDLASTNGKFNLGDTDLNFALASTALWIPLLYGICENTKNFGIDQSYVQRYQAAQNEGDARRSLWLGVAIYIPLSVVFLLIGTVAHSYYQTHPELFDDLRQLMAIERLAKAGTNVSPETLAATAAQLTDAEIGDRVVPHLVLRELPAGVTGLVVAAIFAAAMSSIDTALNSSASVIYLDIYRRFIRPDCTERQAMRVLHTATVLLGAASVAFALGMMGVKSVLDVYWALTGAFSGGLLGLFLLSLIGRWVAAPAAVMGVVAGVIVTAWLSIPDKLAIPASLRLALHAHIVTVVATLTVFAAGVLVAALASRRGGQVS